jgi:hypothetical protein
MNKFDIENIEKEITKREAANYKFTKGGDLTKDNIEAKSTEELKKLIKDFNNNKKNESSDKIKSIVDEIFEKFGEDEDNMIVLGACKYYEDSRHTSLSDDPLEDIDFDGFGHRYNKLAYPIGRNFDISYHDWGGDTDYKGEDDEKMQELYRLAKKIEQFFKDLGLQNIEEYWDDNNDALNECWYGVHAITKDYKIVTFVIRDDGMLCDEDGFDTFHNHILCNL